MDVLEYYYPKIDWERFSQDSITNDVWSIFCEIIMLCHAYKHWKVVGREHGRQRYQALHYTESTYGRRKRKDERKAEAATFADHRDRAAFLAAERLWKIANLVGDRKDSQDWNLSLALMLAVGLNNKTKHERANFDVLAFDQFEAMNEVTGDLVAMVEKWRAKAGYREQTL